MFVYKLFCSYTKQFVYKTEDKNNIVLPGHAMGTSVIIINKTRYGFN